MAVRETLAYGRGSPAGLVAGTLLMVDAVDDAVDVVRDENDRVIIRMMMKRIMIKSNVSLHVNSLWIKKKKSETTLSLTPSRASIFDMKKSPGFFGGSKVGHFLSQSSPLLHVIVACALKST